jgi:Cu/Ag efflux pump CusA
VRSVIDVFVRLRILVIAVAVGIIVAGVATLPGMHRDILPESSPVTVDVQTEALGLSAPEVEELVTVPLEKNLFEGIVGVTDMTSDSIPGMSDIELHFAPGTGLYRARQLVQERLNSAFVLPNVSSPPTMIQPVSTTSDVMLVGITSKTQSLIDLSVLSRWTIVPKLLGLDGVANISTYGQSDRQLQIQVDPAKMAAKHVTLADVIAAAGNSQLVSPVSYLQGSTPGTGGYIEDGNQRLDIRHILPFRQPSNLAGVPVTNSVTVGDIADVTAGHQPLIGDALVHGTPGLVLAIQKLPSASVPAVAGKVRQALAELAPGLPGVSVDTTLFSQSTYANTAFGNVATYAIIAGILAVVALLLFLSVRTAFAAVVSTGLSLIVALLVLHQFGYSLNALVLLGLLLALGVVVADATSAGFRPGMGAGLLVALLTMVPLAVSSGTTAGFLHPMVVAFMLAVAASVIVAATSATALTPLLASAGPQGPPRRVAALRARLSSGYRRSVGTVARLPRLVLPACCAAAGIAALAGVPFLHPGQPAFQDRNLVVQWTAAPGTSLTEMDRLATIATQELQAIPGVQGVGATLGRAVTSNQIVASNSGELWVTMKPDANYGATLAAIRAVADDTPGVHGTVSTYETDAMGDVLAAPPGEVVARINGTNYASLEQVARQVQAKMSGVAGVRNAQVQYPQQAPTLDVEVNLDAAERHGLAAGDIRREAATLLQGLTVGNFFENDEVFDVVVLGDASVRSSVRTVKNLLIDDGSGGHVRLGQVASVSVANEPADIKHDNTSLYIDVTADVGGRSVGAAAAGVSSAVASVRLPLTYSTQVLSGTQLDASTQSGAQPGDTVVPGTSFPAFLAYVLAAMLGVFLITQAAVGSWRQALVAFGSLAVSLSGAVLVVYAAGWAGSLGAVAGLAAVFALAARMAITVLARIREGARTAPSAVAREDGAGDLASRITGAAASSSGHVAAAAAVTALALVPFAVSGGPAGLELLFPAACVILGGLATILLVSLYVLPAACLRPGPVLAAATPTSADDEALVPAPRAPEQPGQPGRHGAREATDRAGER